MRPTRDAQTPADRSSPVAPGTRGDASPPIDTARVDARMRAMAQKKIGEIIDRHPDEALAIVRAWLRQER